MSETIDQINQVNIYPIKSCHAATVDGAPPFELAVGLTGFEAYGVADREYIIYDPNEDTFVTQRGWAKGSKKPKFKQDNILATAGVNIAEDHLSVSVSSFGTLEIATPEHDDVSKTIQIFGNDLSVIDQGNEPAAFFSRLLDREVRLVRADQNHKRMVPPRYCRPGASNMLAGADGMPFLMVSQASLDYQHKKNGLELGTVPINRYRGNIVIGGYALGAFMEDQIELMKFGDMAAEVVKACVRCPIPNIDQDNGERGGGGGLAVLRGRAGIIDEGDVGVCFGQNLNHFWSPNITVSVGDPVRVLSVADRPNLDLRAA
jgi:uncharacterized protein YcbX